MNDTVTNPHMTVDEELGLIPGTTPDELTLTDEEKAILAPGEATGAPVEDPATPATEDPASGDDTQPSADAGETDPNNAGDAGAAQDTGPSEEEQRNAELQAQLAASQAAHAQLQRSILEDQQKGLDAQRSELTTNLMDGLITEEEHATQVAELAAKDRDLAGKLAVMDNATTQDQAAAQQAANDDWESASTAFATANPTFMSPQHYDAFDRAVGDVTADPRYQDLSFAKQIEVAASRYAGEMQAQGVTLEIIQPGAAAAATPAAQKAAEVTAPKEDAPKVEDPKDPPKTLASIPSESVNPHQSQTAQIDNALNDPNVSPYDRESIVASMSEAEFERLAQG